MSDTMLTVSALTSYLKYKFNQDPYLQKVTVQGEVTNFRRRQGHQYFSIKDERASIDIVMFSSRFNKIPFELETGMSVVITGKIDLYEKTGRYNLNAETLQLAGEGALHQRFLEIKDRLEKEGLFNRPKKSFPRYPKAIAVATSASGSVIHDIIRTVSQRFPLTKITLFPTVVQGQEAADSIVHALEQIRQHQAEFDIAIVGRGGGSYEDLFCFNEEKVVRAAADFPLPLITSVGHQTDRTLIDEVADYSAATPTMAGEFAVPDKQEEQAQIMQWQVRLNQSLKGRIERAEGQLRRLQESFVFTTPERLYAYQELQLETQRQQLNQNFQKLYHRFNEQYQQRAQQLLRYSPLQKIELLSHQLKTCDQQRLQAMTHYFEQKVMKWQAQDEQLKLLNPQEVLKRGYTYTTAEGKTIESIAKLAKGQSIRIHFNDGIVQATINEIRENEK